MSVSVSKVSFKTGFLGFGLDLSFHPWFLDISSQNIFKFFIVTALTAGTGMPFFDTKVC